jgi:hypothetical protein
VRATLESRIRDVADSGASGDAADLRPGMVTDPTMDDVLRAAGFEVTDAGRQRWRHYLMLPIPQVALDEAQRLLDRSRGRAA